MVRKICPDCHKEHGVVPAERADILTLCCPECHAERVRAAHARDTADDFDQTLVRGPYHPPFERHVRPSASGRRVIRKAEPLG